jgi:hypothetical protein
MAFVFRTGGNTVIRDDSVALPVGYDDASDKSYSYVIGFAPLPGGVGTELYFVLIETDHAQGVAHEFWSGLDVAKFVSREDRARLLEVVAAGIELLLHRAKPTRVFQVTHDTNLPEKALRKHRLIGDIFATNGYIVTEAEPRLGTRSWWMELASGASRDDQPG